MCQAAYSTRVKKRRCSEDIGQNYFYRQRTRFILGVVHVVFDVQEMVLMQRVLRIVMFTAPNSNPSR
jgi:hypothetical protein